MLEPSVNALRSYAGFTVIELMVALIVLGVLLSLAAPAFNEMFERRRIEGQADELVSDLAYAKSESVQRNRNVALFTGGAGTCYTVAAWTTGTGSCDCAAAPRCSGGPIELKTVALSSGLSITDGVTFDFEPVRGALQPPASAASAAVSSGTRTYVVAVNATGRVTPNTH